MTEYVLQSGPLHTFESLYDPRSPGCRPVADFPTIELAPRDPPRRGALAVLGRDPEPERRFLGEFLRPILGGRRAVFGMRDVHQGRAWLLARKFQERRPSLMRYGISEDDLVLLELRDPGRDLALMAEFLPPEAGEMFLHLTSGTFDLFDLFWRRAALASGRPGEDRFRRDVASMAREAHLTLLRDPAGSFVLILNPRSAAPAEVEPRLLAAAKAAGFRITMAPRLFE